VGSSPICRSRFDVKLRVTSDNVRQHGRIGSNPIQQ
jgi:hypothetical protein